MAEFDLDSFVPYQLSVVAGRISRRLEARYKAAFGIRVAEWRIIAHLSQADSASMRDIQSRVELHKSRVSRAAKRLEAAGYIKRRSNARDRRIVDLSLTGSGRAILNEIIPITEEFQEELRKELGEHNIAFRAGLAKLMKDDR